MSGRDVEKRSKGGEAIRHEDAASTAPHPMNRLHADPVVAQAIFRREVQRRAAARAGEVQRAGNGAAQDARAVHETASQGISGAGEALPHLATIQRAFGSHDVGHISAHTDGAATEASRGIGAQAYAMGDHVAFAGAPDLHTAAHEAAHVVQQRAGVHLKDGVGDAGDAYEQHADAVADRVVRGESAQGLLDEMVGGGRGADGGGASTIQRKPDKKDDAHTDAKAEPPSAGQVGSATIHALQAHMKLTSMRMYAAAANMHTIMESATSTEAGREPVMQGLQQQYDVIAHDLDRLTAEVGAVPDLMRGAMGQELGLLRGAWYASNGFNRALSSAYSFTHDKEGRILADATSYSGTITAVQNQLKGIYGALHVDEGDITNHYLERGADIADAVGAAGSEALDDGIQALQLCARKLTADLQSMDDQDASVTATDLLAASSATAAASKAVNAKNSGSVTKAVREVEALQAELAKRSGPKIAKLVRQVGYNSRVSENLYTLNQRLRQVAKEGKHR